MFLMSKQCSWCRNHVAGVVNFSDWMGVCKLFRHLIKSPSLRRKTFLLFISFRSFHVWIVSLLTLSLCLQITSWVCWWVLILDETDFLLHNSKPLQKYFADSLLKGVVNNYICLILQFVKTYAVLLFRNLLLECLPQRLTTPPNRPVALTSFISDQKIILHAKISILSLFLHTRTYTLSGAMSAGAIKRDRKKKKNN